MIAYEALDFLDYFTNYSRKQMKKKLLEELLGEQTADDGFVAVDQNIPNIVRSVTVPDENLFYNPNCQLIGNSGGVQDTMEHSTGNQVTCYSF